VKRAKEDGDVIINRQLLRTAAIKQQLLVSEQRNYERGRPFDVAVQNWRILRRYSNNYTPSLPTRGVHLLVACGGLPPNVRFEVFTAVIMKNCVFWLFYKSHTA
jgi:hypothetical protein